MAKGKSTWKYNKLLTARNNYYNAGGQATTGFLGMDWSNPFKGFDKNQAFSAGMSAAGGLAQGLLSGGRTSTAGNILGSASKIAGNIPGPWGALASGILDTASGVTNMLFGSSLNEQNIAKIESNISNLKNFQSNASDFDTLTQNWANAGTGMQFSDSFVGKDGVFNKDATNKANDLRTRMGLADARVQNTLVNNAENINAAQMQNVLGNTAAFGGELNTQGSDFTNGLIYIDNGGTHESNLYEGVPFGIDSEGVPNLVEEGEVIFNNYVFSNRIKVPSYIKKEYNLKGNPTFAEAIKKLAKESEERPNDPISQRGLEGIVNKLMTAQEMVKNKKRKNNNSFSLGGKVNKYAEGTPQMELFSGYEPTVNTQAIIPGEYGSVTPLVPKNLFDLTLDTTINPKIDIVEAGKKMLAQSNELKAQAKKAEQEKKAARKSQMLADLRYLPALAGVYQVARDFAGYNDPDYTFANKVINANRDAGSVPVVKSSPLGDYMKESIFDRDWYINKMNATSAASRRAIGNSGGSPGSKMAAILAGDYNYINSTGQLARQGEEFNLANKLQELTFNRATNQYNSNNETKVALANAENAMKARSLNVEGTITGAKMMQQAKDTSDLAKSTNFTNLFDNIGNIGWEEYQRNAIASNPALSNYYQNRRGGIEYGNMAKHGGLLTIKKKRKK